jgi:hypothetical protein
MTFVLVQPSVAEISSSLAATSGKWYFHRPAVSSSASR